MPTSPCPPQVGGLLNYSEWSRNVQKDPESRIVVCKKVTINALSTFVKDNDLPWPYLVDEKYNKILKWMVRRLWRAAPAIVCITTLLRRSSTLCAGEERNQQRSDAASGDDAGQMDQRGSMTVLSSRPVLVLPECMQQTRQLADTRSHVVQGHWTSAQQ